MGRSACWN